MDKIFDLAFSSKLGLMECQKKRFSAGRSEREWRAGCVRMAPFARDVSYTAVFYAHTVYESALIQHQVERRRQCLALNWAAVSPPAGAETL